MNNQLTNTLADGTAPFVITSATLVANLNVAKWGGFLTSSAITLTNTTDSTTKDTGALILEGGLGVEKSIVAGGNLTAPSIVLLDAHSFSKIWLAGATDPAHKIGTEAYFNAYGGFNPDLDSGHKFYVQNVVAFTIERNKNVTVAYDLTVNGQIYTPNMASSDDLDDLAIIRGIREVDGMIDSFSLPERFRNKEGYLNYGAITGLLLGVIKQLDQKGAFGRYIS